MLSIEECRKHIDGHEEYSDEEIGKIRDACHGFSRLILDSLRDKIKKNRVNTEDEKLKNIHG